jgi:hypothetical protein
LGNQRGVSPEAELFLCPGNELTSSGETRGLATKFVIVLLSSTKESSGDFVLRREFAHREVAQAPTIEG